MLPFFCGVLVAHWLLFLPVNVLRICFPCLVFTLELYYFYFRSNLSSFEKSLINNIYIYHIILQRLWLAVLCLYGRGIHQKFIKTTKAIRSMWTVLEADCFWWQPYWLLFRYTRNLKSLRLTIKTKQALQICFLNTVSLVPKVCVYYAKRTHMINKDDKTWNWQTVIKSIRKNSLVQVGLLIF